MMSGPSVVVLSSLFPSAARPTSGIFIRERMFRVAQHLPLAVVSPQAWFVGQRVIQLVNPGYRLGGADFEVQDGIEIYRPRTLCMPGLGRRWDGFAMALAALPIMRRLRQVGRCAIIDAHFAYPDGYAASLLGKWLGTPFCVTMRGTEPRHLGQSALRPRVIDALKLAERVFCVSNSLRREAAAAGVAEDKLLVVGNGVDTGVFYPVPKAEARAALGIPKEAKVLVTVGALVERKGFHRVLELLPELRKQYPNLIYLLVGGGSPEGDYSATLRAKVTELGLQDIARFLGPKAPADLKFPLSASDVFVLPSSNEGWANVILEAMACGIPVVASDVGGNSEVICDEHLGSIYHFGADTGLLETLSMALHKSWDAPALVRYAKENTWDLRIRQLLDEFKEIKTAPVELNSAERSVDKGA